jgi:hypothetical protein
LTRDARAADFEEDNTEYLSSSTVNLSAAAFTAVCWVNPESLADTDGIIGQDNGADRDWGVFTSGGGNITFYGFVSTVYKPDTKASVLTAGTWTMVAFAYDGVDTISFSNDAAAWQDYDMGGAMDTEGYDFEIGRQGASSVWDGRMASCGVWSAKLDQATVLTSLYNSGVALQYADLTATETASLVSWWDLGEISGTRSDSVTTNHLTDNNTVTWGDGVNLTLTDNGSVRAAAHHTLPARDFELSTTEYFTVADPFTRADASIAYSGWFVLESLPGAGVEGVIAAQWDSGVDEGFRVTVLANDDGCASCLNFKIGDGTTTPTTVCDVDYTTITPLVVGTSYHFYAHYDTAGGGTNDCSISVNDGALVQANETAAPAEGTATFTIGAEDAGGSPIDGKIGPIKRYTTLPTDAEQTLIYNDGVAQNCAQTNTALAGGTGVMSHCWQLDEYSGNALESDVTGNSVDLTDTNTVTHGVGLIPAVWDGLELNGSSQYMIAADASSLDFTTALTASYWVNYDDQSNQMVISKGKYGGAAGTFGWTTSVDNNDNEDVNVNIFLTTTTGAVCKSPAGTDLLPDREWHHVAAVFDGSGSGNAERCLIYVDGVQQSLTFTGTVPATIATNDEPLWIGRNDGLDRYYNGTLGPVGLWGAVLNTQQIQQLYNGGYGLTYEQLPDGLKNASSSLVSYWNLNRNDYKDSVTASANDLTASGTPTMAEGIVPIPGGVTLPSADFELSNSETLSVADNAALSLGADSSFGIYAFVKPESLTASQHILSKDDVGANREYSLYQNATTYTLGVFDSVGGFDSVTTAASDGLPLAGEWEFIAGWRDTAVNTIYIQKDLQTVRSNAASPSTRDLSADFRIGSRANNANYWDGMIGPVVFLKDGFWTAAQRELFYNSGVPHACDSLSALGLDTNLVACWDLDELSGDRAESGAGSCGATCDLTDTNTVTSQAGLVLGDALGAAEFDGSAAATLDSKTTDHLSGASAVSIEFWTNVDEADANRTWLTKWDGDGIAILSSSSTAQFRTSGANYGYINGSLTSELWHHCVWVYDGSGAANADRLKFYQDGVAKTLTFAGTIPATIPAMTGTAFTVGDLAALAEFSGKGVVTRAWSRAISATEVTCLYNSGRGRAYPFSACTQ